jgi:hypothetical protein
MSTIHLERFPFFIDFGMLFGEDWHSVASSHV